MADEPVGRRLFSSAVTGALSTYVNCDLQKKVLATALERCNQAAVPESGDAVQRFVLALKHSLEIHAGQDVASAIIAELAPLFLLAEPEEDTHVRRRRRVQEEFSNHLSSQDLRAIFSSAPPTLSKGAEVVLSTTNISRAAAVKEHMAPFRRVSVAKDFFFLVDCIEKGPVLLVVDCASPSLQFTTLTTIAADLPTGSAVILWGEPADQTIISAASRVARSWIRCSGEVSPFDLAAVCRMMLRH